MIFLFDSVHGPIELIQIFVLQQGIIDQIPLSPGVMVRIIVTNWNFGQLVKKKFQRYSVDDATNLSENPAILDDRIHFP